MSKNVIYYSIWLFPSLVTQLLFLFGAVADAEVGDLQDSRYSPGGRHIIALLSSYMSGSCDGQFQQLIFIFAF